MTSRLLQALEQLNDQIILAADQLHGKLFRVTAVSCHHWEVMLRLIFPLPSVCHSATIDGD
jgi:hypothetical protein